MTNTDSSIIRVVIISFIILLSAGMFAWQVSRFVKSAAVDGCIESSLFQAESTNGQEKTVSRTPIDEWYALCMQEKGYKTTVHVQQ